MSKLTAVELFAGIGGFRIACDQQGLETVFANDICTKAGKVYADRCGRIVLGDIAEAASLVPTHDLLTAGIPCQPFSSAGKKKGIQDPRGTLFESVVRLLGRHEPSFFVIENVKRLLTMERGLHFATILDALSALPYEIEWRLINALDFGLAQNRQRVVISGVHSRIAKPGTRLASAEDMEVLCHGKLKSVFDRKQWTRLEAHTEKFPNWGRAAEGMFVGADLSRFSDAQSPVLLASILESDVDPSFDFTDSTLERIKNSTRVDQYVQGVHILYNQGGGARMGYTVFGINGVAPTVTATASRHYERYQVRDRFRRLTNVEYARLQGFPDDHCQAVSTYDQYALFGNAFPPPMAKWAIGRTICEQDVMLDAVEVRGQLALSYG